MSNLRVSGRALVQILEELESEEEEVIKFACRDLMSRTSVLEMLSELNEGNSCSVILELLCLLKRFDLIKKYFMMTKAEAETRVKQSRYIPDFRYFMIDVSEQVEEHELESIVFLLKDDLRNGSKLKSKTFLSLIVELEKNQLVTPSNLHLLEKQFETIHRVDLKKKIHKFLNKDNIISAGPYINAFPALASSRKGSAVCSPMQPRIEDNSNRGATPVQETMSQIEERDERYPIRQETMGFCVIIDCVGNDAEMLQVLFRSLKFVVHCHLYKNIDEVKKILQDIANMEQHKNHDIFVCVIISRGNAESLFCLDGSLPGLSLDRIKNFFTGQSCPNLRGKPKLFFIQNYFACDIEESREGNFVQVDGHREDATCPQRIQHRSKIPNEADIFWSHCRVDELELQRSSGSPSLFLRSLRDLLNDNKTRKHRDLLDIHTELNRIIYTKQAGYSLQLRHTLTKKLFLYPA